MDTWRLKTLLALFDAPFWRGKKRSFTTLVVTLCLCCVFSSLSNARIRDFRAPILDVGFFERNKERDLLFNNAATLFQRKLSSSSKGQLQSGIFGAFVG